MKKRTLALFLALVLCWSLVPRSVAAESTKLPAPTDVKWSHGDPNHEKGVDYIDGTMYWAGSFADQGLEMSETFTVKLYQADTNELVDTYFNAVGYEFVVQSDKYRSGNYYFTVQAIATDDTHTDSDEVASSVWTYVKPTTKVDAPLKAPEWYAPEDYFDQPGWYSVDVPNGEMLNDKVAGFLEEVWFSKTNGSATPSNDADMQLISASVIGAWAGEEHGPEGCVLDDIQQFGQGYYYVRVYMLSLDITQNCNSDWSPLSVAYYYEGDGEEPVGPSDVPSTEPSAMPSSIPDAGASTNPSIDPSEEPSASPSTKPSGGGSSGSRPSGGGGGSAVSQPTPSPAPTQSQKPAESPKPEEPSAPPATPASETFTDVVKDSWYEAGIIFVVDRGLFQGMAEGVFSPDTNMTRAMLMTVLARLDGQDTAGGETWYAKGMDWAKANGISDGTMAESSVTREQLVTMLYRYAKPAAPAGGLTAFADHASVSAWAADAMTWAVEQGIVTGKDGHRLDPQGTATRAEVATIIQRFVEKTGK